MCAGSFFLLFLLICSCIYTSRIIHLTRLVSLTCKVFRRADSTRDLKRVEKKESPASMENRVQNTFCLGLLLLFAGDVKTARQRRSAGTKSKKTPARE